MFRFLTLLALLPACRGFQIAAPATYRGQAARISKASACSSLRMDVADVKATAEDKFQKSISVLKTNLATLRTGKASPSILDRVVVDYYGTETPLNQLAGISTPTPSSLLVDPYDKSAMADIEKAIISSDVGMAPNNDGNVIRLNVPPMTEERRKEIQKQAKSIGEDSKTALRNVRKDAMTSLKKLEKDKEIGEDESKGGQDDVQKLTDKYVKEADEIAKKKEADIMKV